MSIIKEKIHKSLEALGYNLNVIKTVIDIKRVTVNLFEVRGVIFSDYSKVFYVELQQDIDDDKLLNSLSSQVGFMR